MAEQTIKRYNLQPLSPNMVKKAPLSDWSASARAAGANIGSPAGIQTAGEVEALNARLRYMSDDSRRKNQMETAKLKMTAANQQLSAAMQGDQVQMKGLQFDAQQEAIESAGSDPLAIAGDVVSAGQVLGGFMGALERATAKKDENGLRVLDDDGYAGGASGFFGGVRKAIGKVMPRVGRERQEELAASDMRLKVMEGRTTEQELAKYLSDFKKDIDGFAELSGFITEEQSVQLLGLFDAKARMRDAVYQLFAPNASSTSTGAW